MKIQETQHPDAFKYANALDGLKERVDALVPNPEHEFARAVATDLETRIRFISVHHERPPFRYITLGELVLDVGRPNQVDLRTMDVEPMELGQCFHNAFTMAVDNPNLTYCEGYALASILPVEHAWLEDVDGNVIDPTWKNLPGRGTATEAGYFGVRFSTQFLLHAVMESGYTGILTSDWMLANRSQRLGLEMEDGIAIAWKEEIRAS